MAQQTGGRTTTKRSTGTSGRNSTSRTTGSRGGSTSTSTRARRTSSTRATRAASATKRATGVMKRSATRPLRAGSSRTGGVARRTSRATASRTGPATSSRTSRAASTRTRRATTSRASSNGRSANGRYPQILTILKREHEEVKKLFRDHERAAERDHQRATDLKRQIISELERHSTMEEQIVYPGLKEKDEEFFHEATEEHHAVDLLVGEVMNATPDNPAYKAKMTVLRENVEHHIEEEEDEGFKQLRKLPADRLEQIARRWQEVKEAGIPAFMQTA